AYLKALAEANPRTAALDRGQLARGNALSLSDAAANTEDARREQAAGILVETNQGRLIPRHALQTALAEVGHDEPVPCVDHRQHRVAVLDVRSGAELEIGDQPVGRRDDAREAEVQLRLRQLGPRLRDQGVLAADASRQSLLRLANQFLGAHLLGPRR